MDYVDRMKERRKQLKMTFDELSEKSGIAKNTIYGVFSRKTQNPRIDTVYALEKALGISRDAKPPNVTYLTREQIEWLDLCHQMDELYGEECTEHMLKMIELMCKAVEKRRKNSNGNKT